MTELTASDSSLYPKSICRVLTTLSLTEGPTKDKVLSSATIPRSTSDDSGWNAQAWTVARISGTGFGERGQSVWYKFVPARVKTLRFLAIHRASSGWTN